MHANPEPTTPPVVILYDEGADLLNMARASRFLSGETAATLAELRRLAAEMRTRAADQRPEVPR